MFHSTSLAKYSTITQQQSRRRSVPALFPGEPRLPSVILPYFTMGALPRCVVCCTVCPSAVHAATLPLPLVGFRHSCCSCSCAVAFALVAMLSLPFLCYSPFSPTFVLLRYLLFLYGVHLPSNYHGNKHPPPTLSKQFYAALFIGVSLP